MSEAETKSISRETFEMAWPSVLESVLVALAGMVDTYMVSGLGKASVAAIGVTNQPKYFVFTFFYAINSGISLLIARRVGEKRRREANITFLSGLSVIIAANIALTVLCLTFAEPFMGLCGANSETVALSVMYFRIVIGFSIFSVISLYINAAQRGSGNTKIAMTTDLTSNAVNVVMNYLLIGGHLGFPALGVKGAAIATVLGTVVACIMISARCSIETALYIFPISSRNISDRILLPPRSLDRSAVRSLERICFPGWASCLSGR